MKFFIVLLAGSIIATTSAMDEALRAEVRSRIKAKIEQCGKELNASPEDLQTIFAKNIPDTPAGRCITFCVHKKFNIQNTDGSLNEDGVQMALLALKEMHVDTYDKMVEIFDKCKSIPMESDPCNFAVSLFKCVYKEAETAGIHDVIIE